MIEAFERSKHKTVLLERTTQRGGDQIKCRELFGYNGLCVEKSDLLEVFSNGNLGFKPLIF